MSAAQLRSCIQSSVLLLLLLLAGACTDDDGSADPDLVGPNAADTLFDRSHPTPGISDQEIWEAVYEGKRTPPDFYREPLDGSLYYLNTISITPLHERENAWIELNTEDSAQVRIWSALTEQYGSGERTKILRARETEKYLETHRSNGKHDILYRAHRSSYIDVDGVDLLHKDSYQGRLTQRPITGDAVQELVEYFWFIRHDKVGGVAVLCCDTSEEPQAFVTTLIEAQLMSGDWNVRDEIRLLRHGYTVDRHTGEISLVSTVLEEFVGR